MPSGLRISVSGEFFTFCYTLEDLHCNNMDLHTRERGRGEFILLEQWAVINKVYFVYGWLDGLNFNSFDLEFDNSCGDIIIYCLSSINGAPINVDVIDIRDHYRPIDLDEFIIEDELNLNVGEYEYNEFVLDEDDYLDFIDYP